jgi:hypothetical protein
MTLPPPSPLTKEEAIKKVLLVLTSPFALMCRPTRVEALQYAALYGITAEDLLIAASDAARNK